MININDYLSADKINEYKASGYSDVEIQEAVQDLANSDSNSSFDDSYDKAVSEQDDDPRNFASNTIVSGVANQNLVQWQLELDSILERVEHMLRGDKPHFKNGSLIFLPPSSNEEKVFTDIGVSEVMRILSMYLNRNTILSNYDEETINWKVYDFGKEMSDLIYLKYEVMFATMSFEECFGKIFKTKAVIKQLEDESWVYENKDKDSGVITWINLDSVKHALVIKEFRTQRLEKRKLYPMLVRQLVDAVHSAYLRALNGGERQSLHEARQVTQSENLMGGMNGYNPSTGQTREKSVMNPSRWFK